MACQSTEYDFVLHIVLRIERFPPLHRLLHGSFCINWGCFDSHVSWQPDILPSIRNKTCINKLRNCAAYYVCSCSLFCKWPWYYDTAHGVFPMNVSWHAKDWSGLTAQNIDSLNQPWYISRMGFIKVVPKQSTSQGKKSLVLRHDQEILDTSLAVSRVPVYYACLTWCCETRKSTSAVTNNAQIGEFHIQWTIISWETLVWMTTLYVSNDNDQYYRRQQTFPSYICPTQ